MEESKAAEYYEELTRKGEGAARFKLGLGFASNRDGDVRARGSALPSFSSSSSFLSSFVRASSPSKTSQFERESQLKSIQDKLRKKSHLESTSARVSDKRNGSRDGRIGLSSRRRSRSRDRDSRRRRRSVSRDRGKRSRDRDRRRSRSRSGSAEDRKRERDRSGSCSPHRRREKGVKDIEMSKNEKVDYGKVIEGFDKMTPAERVKAKMKFQLAETAEKDATKGMGSGWERFDFDKDAPLDDDDDIKAVEDDAALVKHIGQTFRHSAVEARRAEEIKTAHDEAIFGGASAVPCNISDDDTEVEEKVQRVKHIDPDVSLLSEKVLVKQTGSWRDRVRKS